MMIWLSCVLLVLFVIVVVFILPSLLECSNRIKKTEASLLECSNRIKKTEASLAESLEEILSQLERFTNGIDLQKLENDRREIISQGISEVERHVTELFEKLDKESRCPKCRGICRSEVKFCPHCGEDFFKEKEPAINARVLSSYGGPYMDQNLTIDWECLVCDDQHSEEFSDDDLDGRGIFICPLKCSSCDEYCGEVVVDPDLTRISRVFLPGQFDLSNAVAAFQTKEVSDAKVD